MTRWVGVDLTGDGTGPGRALNRVWIAAPPGGNAWLLFNQAGARVFVNVRTVAPVLRERHYLGEVTRGVAWHDEFGVIVVAKPTARRLPGHWLELVRWCITSEQPNAGSRQWARFVRALREQRPDVTTIVSYSDPSVGHTGALYRACNWWLAPTWHRLRPPPSGNGKWKSDEQQSVKDRWVFAMRRETTRVSFLRARDESILRRKPWAVYREPGGADFKRFATDAMTST